MDDNWKKMKRFPIKVISTQESNVLQVRFFPTDICNYNCSYCFAGSHDGIYRYPTDVDTIIKNFKILFDYYKNNFNKTVFHLVIAGGGEPTLWPGLDLFCKKIKDVYDVRITIVSNGSRTTQWWSDNSMYFDKAILSCHHEFVDINHFIEVADLLFESGTDVTALALMDAEHWNTCVSNIDCMQNSKYSWYIQAKVIVDAPGKGADAYTSDQHAYINNSLKRIPTSDWLLPRIHELKLHDSVVLFNDESSIVAQSHTILLNQWNGFYGWECKIGLESISIDVSGLLKAACGLSMFVEDLNIFSKDFKINYKPKNIKCTNVLCTCQPDTHATKTRP